MANLDDIFKSNLDESKKKAKMLFGKMLISLRKSNRMKLYAMLESVSEMDLLGGVLKLTMLDKTAYEMINNKSDLEIMTDAIGGIESGISVELICNSKERFDLYKFESKLKEEFGKILTIKKEN